MNRLRDKICVITGAGGGMGADAAELFTEEGAKVVVADVNGAAAQEVAAKVGGLAVQVDVADEESVQAMYAAAKAECGGIDVLKGLPSGGVVVKSNAGKFKAEWPG